MSVENMIISFAFFSVIGWEYESFICSLVKDRKFINRGVLVGPYCPIYGAGAVCCYLALHNIRSVLVMFVAAALLCSVIEYFTGYMLENALGEKSWDYTRYPFQIHGRVCLYGATIFGLGNVFICKIAAPLLLRGLSYMSRETAQIISVFIVSTIIIDLIVTLLSQYGQHEYAQFVYIQAKEKSNQGMEELSDKIIEKSPIAIPTGDGRIQVKIQDINEYLKEKEKTWRDYI